MPITLSRDQFLRTVRSVIPGITRNAIQEQSDSIGFKNGYATTFNENVFCRVPSGLPKELTAVVKAKKLVAVLDKFPDPQVEVEIEGGRFRIVANKGRRWVKMAMEAEVLLPLDTVVMPKKEDWQRIHSDFTDAIGVVGECASSNANAPRFTCVHIHPKYMEACDGDQVIRYRLKTGVSTPTLVKRDSLRYVPGSDPTHFAETVGWIYFRNSDRLIIGCRKFNEEYPDLKAMLDVDGVKSVLPKGLADEAKIAEEFSNDNAENNMVKIDLKPGALRIVGEGDGGEGGAIKKIKYSGPPMKFWISPKLLIEIVKRQTECEIDGKKYHLRITGEKFVYTACLERTREKVGEEKPKKKKGKGD